MKSLNTPKIRVSSLPISLGDRDMILNGWMIVARFRSAWPFAGLDRVTSAWTGTVYVNGTSCTIRTGARAAVTGNAVPPLICHRYNHAMALPCSATRSFPRATGPRSRLNRNYSGTAASSCASEGTTIDISCIFCQSTLSTMASV